MGKMTNSFEMVLSEKGMVNGKNQYVPKGKATIFYPTLEEMGVAGTEITGKDEEGFPIYKDDRHSYLFDSLLAAVKANARNKLEIVADKVQVKEGLSLPETVEELMTSGSGNSGAALANFRDFLAAVKGWLATIGKSLAVQEQVFRFVKTPSTIGLVQDQSKRDRIRSYITDFAATLNAEQIGKWSKYLTQVDEACNNVVVLDDF